MKLAKEDSCRHNSHLERIRALVVTHRLILEDFRQVVHGVGVLDDVRQWHRNSVITTNIEITVARSLSLYTAEKLGNAGQYIGISHKTCNYYTKCVTGKILRLARFYVRGMPPPPGLSKENA